MVGRPLKFQSVEILQKRIDEYFLITPKEEWTWTGLALFLDTDKEVLTSYKERPEFSDSIKNAMLKVENGYEIELKKYGRSGTIFALKNFNWKDRNEVDVTTLGEKINIINYGQLNNPSQLFSENVPTKVPAGSPEVQDSGIPQESGQK